MKTYSKKMFNYDEWDWIHTENEVRKAAQTAWDNMIRNPTKIDEINRRRKRARQMRNDYEEENPLFKSPK